MPEDRPRQQASLRPSKAKLPEEGNFKQKGCLYSLWAAARCYLWTNRKPVFTLGILQS
jgi:hypothetical protein